MFDMCKLTFSESLVYRVYVLIEICKLMIHESLVYRLYVLCAITFYLACLRCANQWFCYGYRIYIPYITYSFILQEPLIYTTKVFWGVKKTDEQLSKWQKTTIMLKCEDKVTEMSPPQMIDWAPNNPFLIFDHTSHQPLHWDLVDDHYTPYRSPPRPWRIVYHNTSLMCHSSGWFWL